MGTQFQVDYSLLIAIYTLCTEKKCKIEGSIYDPYQTELSKQHFGDNLMSYCPKHGIHARAMPEIRVT